MPAFPHVAEFTIWVQRCNPKFRKSASSLKALFAELESDAYQPFKAEGRIREIPQPKTARYLDALHYLLHRVPTIPYSAINIGNRPKCRAARFAKAVPWHGFADPVAPQNLYTRRAPVVGAPGAFTGTSIDEYLLRTAHDVGIVLIHLGTEVNEMKNVVDAKTAADHVNTALNIAAIRGLPVRSLLLKPAEPAVCGLLKTAWDRVADKAAIVREGGHMGTKIQAFTQFVTGHDTAVVMGYDGTVCVHANIFGTSEYNKVDDTFVALTPILALANVVTARSVLMLNGTLTRVGGCPEYGALHNT